MKSSIVLGLGFGDEGKGMVTSFLCARSKKSLVIRFSGGHQAGHTVVENGHRHVFSHFGSGTLQGAPTYWSHFCTFSPHSFLNEYKLLEQFNPVIFVDMACPVVTPFDIIYNKKTEIYVKHGSVGVGFGATIERAEQQHYHLFVRDMFHPVVFRQKVASIADYYQKLLGDMIDPEGAQEYANTRDGIITQFCREAIEASKLIRAYRPEFSEYDNLVFEGSQGILLDQKYGFFPHVTRSNTTSKNAISLLAGSGLLDQSEICYVTRSYQTRHGYGPMTYEGACPPLINNEAETNVHNDWQRNFRTGALDIDYINYAIACDRHYSQSMKSSLAVTCLDQTGYDIPASVDGLFYESLPIADVVRLIDHPFQTVMLFCGPDWGAKIPQKLS